MSLVNGYKVRLSPVVVNGTTVTLGEFDSYTNPGWDSDETSYTPFDGEERKYLAFPKKGNITVMREQLESRDGALKRLDTALHNQAVTATILDRDDDGNYQQNLPPRAARIKQFILEDGNSNENGVSMIGFELSVGKAGS